MTAKHDEKTIHTSTPPAITPPVPEIPAATVVSVTSTTPTATSAPQAPSPPTLLSATSSSSFTLNYANSLVSPPDVEIPSPPVGFQKPDPNDFSGFRPLTRQVAAAQAAIGDLTNFADFNEVLGSAAGDKALLASALLLGIHWRTTRDLTAAWDDYVRAEDGLAWKAALTLLDKLRPLFLSAVAANPALATQYAGLMAMFQAPKVVRKTRTTKAKTAKAKAASTAATAPAATPAPATPTATPPTTEASVPKSVTINT